MSKESWFIICRCRTARRSSQLAVQCRHAVISIVAEGLQRYCEAYNDQPQDTEVHVRYEVHELDYPAMQRAFLDSVDSALSEDPATARQEALQLYIVADAPWRTIIPREGSPWYRPDRPYPALSA